MLYKSTPILFSQFARRVKVVSPNSPYFKVSSKTVAAKIAAGMDSVYSITFLPATDEDYEWDLVVCTEREKFLVPVRCHGSRGRLDLPDCFDFGPSNPCKLTAAKTLLVHNVGRRSTAFTMACTAPFSVAPSAGQLNVGESLQWRVKFTPQSMGLVEGTLTVRYENGEIFTINLSGSGSDVDAFASPSEVTFLKTYISKTTQKTFRIVNNSSMPLSFALMKFGTAAEEKDVSDEVLLTLNGTHAKDLALIRDKAQCEDTEGVTALEAAEVRRFKKLIVLAKSQRHLFGTECMRAYPLEGTVFPASQREVRFCI
jgi:hydrocephalus-inducing protein